MSAQLEALRLAREAVEPTAVTRARESLIGADARAETSSLDGVLNAAPNAVPHLDERPPSWIGIVQQLDKLRHGVLGAGSRREAKGRDWTQALSRRTTCRFRQRGVALR